MDARLNLLENPVAAKSMRQLITAGRTLADSDLPARTRHLVALRVSQINGCGYCVDMHSKDAAHDGDSWERISLVAAWREATVFTGPERAAFELADQGTRIADGGSVTDEAWAAAAQHYDEDQLAALVLQIAFMNTVNRLNVITRQPAGGYQPGQHG